MKYYLVGIKGAGMLSLAKILIDLGNEVTGIDQANDFYTNDDIRLNIDTFENYKLDSGFFYIIGNAYQNHPIVDEIKKLGGHLISYPAFLDKYIVGDKIVVAGTHGKTTTTKFISQIIDSSYLIGDGEGRGKANSKYFVFEACEYKDTFLNYHPKIAIILNVDYDHPDYFKSVDDCANSFYKLIDQSEFVIYNGDDERLKKIKCINSISFGFNPENDLVCKYKRCNNGYELYLSYAKKTVMIYFPHLGKHNIYNFLACYVLCHLLGVEDYKIIDAAKHIKLPKRRFSDYIYGSNHVICDYAHHPAEIKAFFETLSLKYPFSKKVLIFEPHTYSRTIKFYQSFKAAFSLFDEVYLCGIFSSVREKGDNDYLFDGDYPRYDKKVEDKILEYKQTCFCFLGAGINDQNASEFTKKMSENN